MYYFVRLIIIGILFIPVLVWLFLHKNIKIKKTSRFRCNNHKKVLLTIIVIYAVLFLLLLYPYESFFVRFDTIDQSINYSLYKNPILKMGSQVYTTEDEDTVFFVNVRGNNYSYHSIAKDDNGYGFCDVGTYFESTASPPQLIDIGTSTFTVDNYNIYNKTTDKTCLIVTVLKNMQKCVDAEIYNDKQQKLVTFQNKTGSIDNYYIVHEGKPNDKYIIYIDGYEVVL